MSKHIPISAAKRLAEEQGQDIVMLVTWQKDGNITHTVTYGKTVEDCDFAAQGMDIIRKAMKLGDGMPVLPSRVKALKAEVARLKEQLKAPGDKPPCRSNWKQDNPRDQAQTVLGALAGHLSNCRHKAAVDFNDMDRMQNLIEELGDVLMFLKGTWEETC